MFDMPSGVQFSFFGSFEVGSDAYPLSSIPFDEIVAKVQERVYKAKPARALRPKPRPMEPRPGYKHPPGAMSRVSRGRMSFGP